MKLTKNIGSHIALVFLACVATSVVAESGCIYDGRPYNHLDMIQHSNGCTKFQCQFGNVVTILEACGTEMDNQCHPINEKFMYNDKKYHCVKEIVSGVTFYNYVNYASTAAKSRAATNCIIGVNRYKDGELFYGKDKCRIRQCQNGKSPLIKSACRDSDGKCYYVGEMWLVNGAMFTCQRISRRSFKIVSINISKPPLAPPHHAVSKLLRIRRQAAVTKPPRAPRQPAVTKPPRAPRQPAVTKPPRAPRQPAVSKPQRKPRQPAVSKPQRKPRQPAVSKPPRAPKQLTVSKPLRAPKQLTVSKPLRAPKQLTVSKPPRAPKQLTVSKLLRTPQQPAVSKPPQTPRQPAVSKPPRTPRPPAVSKPPQAPRQPTVSKPPRTPRPPAVSKPPQTPRQPTVSKPPQAPRQPTVSKPPQAPRQPTVSKPPQAPRQPTVSKPPQAPRQPTVSKPPRTPRPPAVKPCFAAGTYTCFVIDSSASVLIENFYKSVQLIKLVDGAVKKAHWGAVTFGSSATIISRLTRKTKVFNMSLMNARYHNSTTNIAAGIDLGCSILNAAPGKATKLLVVLFDGKSIDSYHSKNASVISAHERGIITVAIGVGDNPNMEELIGIASDSSKVTVIGRDGDLIKTADFVASLVCGGSTKSTRAAVSSIAAAWSPVENKANNNRQ